MNRNGRRKEARAIFLIMKTLLCVSFCFVLSEGAILIGRSPTSLALPHPSSSISTLFRYHHCRRRRYLLFLYYNVRALSDGSDGSGAEEAGLLLAGYRAREGARVRLL